MTDIDPATEEEYQQRRQELIEDAAETKRQLDADQQEILSSIQEEHGGDLVETPVSITNDHTATVKTKVDGTLLNRLGEVEDAIEDYEEGGGIRDVERTMDRAAGLLADVIDESEYTKDLFYGVYEAEGPDALGVLISRIFEAIDAEQKRKVGAVDGFREQ